MKSGHSEHKKEKEWPDAKKRGGEVKEDERTKEEVSEEMKGHKHGGEVKGKEPRHRPDRRARGGRMTPKSPFSGADTGRASYQSTVKAVGPEGKGKEPRP